MNYTEKKTLLNRDSVQHLPEISVDGTLLVGDIIADYTESHSIAGHDGVVVRLAIHNGNRGFLIRKTWFASDGYNACGAYEEFVSLEDGIKLLVENCSSALDKLFYME